MRAGRGQDDGISLKAGPGPGCSAKMVSGQQRWGRGGDVEREEPYQTSRTIGCRGWAAG